MEYGILIKNRDHYNYFRGEAEELRQNIGQQWTEVFQDIEMSKNKKAHDLLYSSKNKLYSHKEKVFPQHPDFYRCDGRCCVDHWFGIPDCNTM